MKKRTKQLKKLVELTRKLREANQAADAALDQGLDAAKRQQLAKADEIDVDLQRFMDAAVKDVDGWTA